MVAAVILASGYSRRMGENKLLLKYNNKYLIEYVLDAVISCSFHEILLIGRDENILTLAKSRGIKTVFNSKAHLGQSESIKLGIENSDMVDGYMFFTGDQPFIDKYTIERLLEAFYKYKDRVIVPKVKERRGSPVIFPISFRDELLNLQGDQGGKVIINNNLDKVKFIGLENEKAFLDIDTKEDYKNICSIKKEE